MLGLKETTNNVNKELKEEPAIRLHRSVYNDLELSAFLALCDKLDDANEWPYIIRDGVLYFYGK